MPITKLPVTTVTSASLTAFGEQSVETKTPQFQGDFSYTINPTKFTTFLSSGTAVSESARLKLSTGAAANQSAGIESKISIKFHSGAGVVCRFSAAFTTGVANSQQTVGIGDTSDGFFFGYNGADFGVLHRRGGSKGIVEFTVTTGNSTATDPCTITLDGDTKVFNFSDTSGSVDITAREIAAQDYSTTGNGWTATALGDTVTFISFDSSANTAGTFSLSATTAVATTSVAVTGVAPTDTWTTQANWNIDKADGTQNFPNVDWTKGNVFQIRTQWLGHGAATFWVENPDTGVFEQVHRFDYAGTQTVPHLARPILPYFAEVKNTTNTSDIIVYGSSAALFLEGEIPHETAQFGTGTSRTGVTTEESILQLHNHEVYNGVQNRGRLKLLIVALSSDGTKPVTVRFYVNAGTNGAAFTDHQANVSIAKLDTTSTSAPIGGTEIYESKLGRADAEQILLGDQIDFYLNPGETLTVTGQSATSNEVGVSIFWEEVT